MCSRTFFRAVLNATAGLLLIAGSALAGPPPVIWSQANPGGLAASVGAVAWAPSGTNLTFRSPAAPRSQQDRRETRL